MLLLNYIAFDLDVFSTQKEWTEHYEKLTVTNKLHLIGRNYCTAVFCIFLCCKDWC